MGLYQERFKHKIYIYQLRSFFKSGFLLLFFFCSWLIPGTQIGINGSLKAENEQAKLSESNPVGYKLQLSPEYIITDIYNGEVILSWTATGDDSTTGRATGYDIRYQSSFLGPIINENQWDSAFQVGDEPQPSPAGQVDSMIVTGLEEGMQYYFCIKAYDEVNNYSGLSNSPLLTAVDLYHLVNTTVTGCGSIDIDPAKQFYTHGESVEITAEPCNGWAFDSWNGDISGHNNPVTITIIDDLYIEAVFIEDFIAGDANGNGFVQMSDITYLSFFFRGINPPPVPYLAGDANSNCLVTLQDITYLVNYFRNVLPAPQHGDCD